VDVYSENYLSYETFRSGSAAVDDHLESLDLINDYLGSYSVAFERIRKSKEAAEALLAIIKICPPLLGYVKKLSAFEEALLNEVGKTTIYDKIPDGMRRLCDDISARTEFLDDLIAVCHEAQNEASRFRENIAAQQVPEQEIRRIVSSVLKTLSTDMSAGMPGVGIVAWESDVHITPLSRSLTADFIAHLRAKIKAVYEVQSRAAVAYKLGVVAKAWLSILGPGADAERINASAATLLDDYRKIADEIMAISPPAMEFDARLEAVKNKTGETERSTAGLRETLAVALCGRLKSETAALGAFTLAWIDGWVEGSAVKTERARLQDALARLAAALDAGLRVPLEERIRRLDEAFGAIDAAVEKIAGNYYTTMFNRQGPEIRSFISGLSDIRELLDMPRLPISYLCAPVFDETGRAVDAQIAVCVQDERDCTIFSVARAGDPYESFDDVAEAIEKHMMEVIARSAGNNINLINRHQQLRTAVLNCKAALTRDMEDHNRLMASRRDADAGIALFPPHCLTLVQSGFKYYQSFASVALDARMPSDRLIDLEEALAYIADNVIGRPIGLRVGEQQGPDSEFMARLSVLDAKGSLNSGEKTTQAALRDTLSLYRAWRSKLIGPEHGAVAQHFMASVTALLRRLSGREAPPAPAPSLGGAPLLMPTVPQEKKAVEPAEVNLFAFYPPAEEYKGVYFNPRHLSFSFLPTEAGMKTAVLCEILNDSLREYLMKVTGLLFQPQEHKDERWFSNILETYGEMGRIAQLHVAVVDGLPVNSLISGDTIFLDKAFVDTIIDLIYRGRSGQQMTMVFTYADYAEFISEKHRDVHNAGAYILGERIMHELGHVYLRGKKLSALDEETEQLWNDVLAHERLYGINPRFVKEIDSFTDTMVSARGGSKDKFSHVFNSSYLFKNIRRWALMRAKDPSTDEKIKAEIRQFAFDVLKYYKILPPDARLFPVVQEPSPGRSFESALALLVSRSIAVYEKEMLDSLRSRDKVFLSEKRRIVVSESLIPACQRNLVDQINERSKAAFGAGYTNDLIEIRPFSYVQNVKTEDGSDAVVLLEKEESLLYRGTQKRLIFSREGDSPVLLNGLIAAGRAVLYNDMSRLKTILARLGGIDEKELPPAEELERLLAQDRDAFARTLVTAFPAIRVQTKDLPDLNDNIRNVIYYA